MYVSEEVPDILIAIIVIDEYSMVLHIVFCFVRILMFHVRNRC